MAAIQFSPIEGAMAGVVTNTPAFPGGRFTLGIPESIGDAARSRWYTTLKSEWKRNGDGLWTSAAREPGELSYSLVVTPHDDFVDVDIDLINESPRAWKQTLAFNCFNCASSVLRDNECLRHWVRVAGRFRRLVELPRAFGPRATIQLYSVEGAPRGEEIPFVAGFKATPDVTTEGWIAIRSRDGRRLAAAASKPALFLFQNMEYSCIHSAPSFGVLAPGETGRARTRFYFVEASLEAWHHRMREEMA